MPAPDSYPHVTCGRAVRGQPRQGVAAIVATVPKRGNFRDDGNLLVPGPESPLDCARRRSLAAIRPGSRWLHGGAASRLAGERSDGAAGLVAGVAASLLLLPDRGGAALEDLARALGSHPDHGPPRVRQAGGAY